jgi:hypothetical protein
LLKKKNLFLKFLHKQVIQENLLHLHLPLLDMVLLHKLKMMNKYEVLLHHLHHHV